MRTWTQLQNFYGTLTNNSDTSNITLGAQIMNDTIRRVCADKGRAWDFLEGTTTFQTVGGTQFYALPYNYDTLIDLTITIGTTTYTPTEAPNRQFWDNLNATTTYESDTPEYFYIYGGQIGIYPTPSSANTAKLNYKLDIIDLSIADYVTGTILTATNGATGIVGKADAGQSFSKSMIGRMFQITPSNTYNNNGDGFWYQIAAVPTATTLTLTSAYQGNSLVASGASYTIAQVPIIPEAFQDMPAYEAASVFYSVINPDATRAQIMKAKADELYADLVADHDSKTTDPVIHDTDPVILSNPNLFISSV
jgi:hypothetical protein